MGILVPELITPDGELISNAYVSYKNSCITTLPRRGQDLAMHGWASVYRNIEMHEAPLYNFEITLTNPDLTRGPFMNMYKALYAMFPTGTPCQEPEDEAAPLLAPGLQRDANTE